MDKHEQWQRHGKIRQELELAEDGQLDAVCSYLYNLGFTRAEVRSVLNEYVRSGK